jgi:flagellar basal-body rod modification protein FlgD
MPIPAILATVGGAVVSGLLQGVTGSSTESATASSTLGKDEFLRLLVAQLKNQDPLNPMDNSQFVAQTAQFSSLEQLQNMNKTLDKLAAAQSGNGGAVGASALLGKTVTVNGSPLALDGTRSATLAYALPTTANAVAIRVVDASGTAVRTMVVGQQGAGTHQAAFDGLDDNGRRLSAGSYTYQVAAADATGRAISGVYTGGGQVTGINVEGGTVVLMLGNQRVPLTSVVNVMAGTALSS